MVEKMKVSISQENRIPIESSTPVSSHESNAYSRDDERIGEEHLLSEIADQKMQQQNAQYNGTVRSADSIRIDDEADNDLLLLRSFLGDMSNYIDSMEMDFSTVFCDYTKENTVNELDFVVRQKNRTAGKRELQLLMKQAEQQHQMILELQNKLQKFAAIQLQQQRQKLLDQKPMRQIQEKVAQKSTVEKSESMRPVIDEIGIVSMDNSPSKLPALSASNEMNSLDCPESIPSRASRRIPKRAEGSKFAVDAIRQLRNLSRYPEETNRGGEGDGSLRKKKGKQVHSNVRAQIYNDAARKNSSAYVRKNSTLHSCKECGKEFNQKAFLITHLRIHTGEKPFKCGECDAAFAQVGNLFLHKRIHLGSKPFKCQICEAAFNQKINLSTHLLIHTNEKPFMCDICKRNFRQKGNLNEHMKMHSGLKPYKCNVCEKTFRQKSNLIKHQKLHTDDEH